MPFGLYRQSRFRPIAFCRCRTNREICQEHGKVFTGRTLANHFTCSRITKRKVSKPNSQKKKSNSQSTEQASDSFTFDNSRKYLLFNKAINIQRDYNIYCITGATLYTWERQRLFRIVLAAMKPGAQVSPPPGCDPPPQRYKPPIDVA